MYGDLAVHKTEEIILSVEKRGDYITVVATQNDKATDVCELRHAYSGWVITSALPELKMIHLTDASKTKKE
jgi:hypothetical protein